LKLCPADIKDGWITIEQSKTGKDVKIPVCKRLVKILASIKVRSLDPDRAYFHGIKGKQVTVAIKRAFKKAGIEGSISHLWHFCASQLINAGYSKELTAMAIGHVPGSRMTDDYIHPYEKELSEAFEVFDKE